MSTPTTLDLPPGVEATTIGTARGPFAIHRATVAEPRAFVLLTPGYTGSKEDFTPLLPLLAEAGFDATSHDLRGQFESGGTPTDDYSLDGLGADAIALATALTDEPIHLLGHSMGGLIAQRAAISAPQSWRSLSLLCTGPSALGETPERPLQALVDALDDGIGLDVIHDLRQQMSGAMHAPDITDFLRRRYVSHSRDALRQMTVHLLHAPDRLDDVIATGLPVWVGRGAKDDAWSHEAQAAMADRLDVEMHIVNDSVHSPAVENPEGLAAAWLPFLEGL